VNISIYYKGIMIYNVVNRSTGWGFSPDEDKFAMHGLDQFGKHWCTLLNLNPDDSREGEWAADYDVVTSSDMSSVSIRFSPHGKYLLYAGVSGATGDLFLRVFDTKNGSIAYDGSTTSLVGSPSGKSIAGWGFSSDNKDATFVHAYLTDVNKYILVVKNLKTPTGDYILKSTPMDGEARWFFSKCGDYFAWIIDSPLSGINCQLYRTDSEEIYTSETAETWWKMVSNPDGQYIKYIKGDSTWMAENEADKTCPDISKPTWENALLDTDLVEALG